MLFVETGRRLELAEQVDVVVEFPTEKRSFRLRGKVVSRRRSSGKPPLPPGVEVEFPTEQDPTLQMVLDHAQGKEVDFVERKGRRVPCSFVVSYRYEGGFISEVAEDIGEGGAFVRTEDLYPIGTLIECRLKPPGCFRRIKLHAKVVWVKERARPRGMGLEFIFTSERQRKRVRELIRKLTDTPTPRTGKGMKRFRTKNRFRWFDRG